jgi:hypothetical protein
MTESAIPASEPLEALELETAPSAPSLCVSRAHSLEVTIPNPNLTVEDSYNFHASKVFGLRIEMGGARRVTVGCSIQSNNGQILDVPHHQLNASGLVLWEIQAPQAFQNMPGMPDCGWSGQIRFALWEGDTFQNRLTDTGWVPCEAYYLIGARTGGIFDYEERIRDKYRNSVASWSYPEKSR